MKRIIIACACLVLAFQASTATAAQAPISQWTAITGSLADGDFFPIADISDTTQSVNGSSRKITSLELKTYLENYFTLTANLNIPSTASDVPVVDIGSIIAAENVEEALQENRAAIDLNTAKNSYPSEDATKLSGIAEGATANSTDAVLLARSNHTGTQLMSTISDAGTAAIVDVGTAEGEVIVWVGVCSNGTDDNQTDCETNLGTWGVGLPNVICNPDNDTCDGVNDLISAAEVDTRISTATPDLSSPGTIGATTPGAATFTTLVADSFDFGTPATGETGEIGLQEDPTNGTNVFTLKAPDALSIDRTIIVDTLVEVVTAPATAADTCTVSQLAYDASYIYICTATDTWLRASIATW